MKKTLIAIVGRPNVGKSTLFNRLTKKWQSIVEDRPGITRDRLISPFSVFGHDCELMDTGGLNFDPKTDIERKMSLQALKGVDEADLILFLMDGRAGVHPTDAEWVKRIRRMNKPTLFLINKIDNDKLETKANEFYELGVEPLLMVSAEKQRNLITLCEQIVAALKLEILPEYQSLLKNPHKRREIFTPKQNEKNPQPEKQGDENLSDLQNENLIVPRTLNLAIIGRPNVGKSTLLNAILNEERSVVDDEPGTTRDPIHTYVTWDHQDYCLIDTAGIRKRAKTKSRVEKFSVMSALNVIDKADMVLLLIDGEIGPTEQDAHVAGYAFEKHKALVVVVNKWDIGAEKHGIGFFENRLELKLNFLSYCPVIYVSAKTKKNLKNIFKAIESMRTQLDTRIRTSELNKAFEHIVDHHPLPTYRGNDIKMFYATQVAIRPPAFVVFCTEPKHVHFTYERYLINALKEVFEWPDIPIRVIFKKR